MALVLLRGIDPLDSEYQLSELVDHMLSLFNKAEALNKDDKEKQEVLTKSLSDFELSFEGSDEENEQKLRSYAHAEWVTGRSIAIKGLKEGLTLDGTAKKCLVSLVIAA